MVSERSLLKLTRATEKELQIPAFNEVSYNDGTLTVRNGAYDAYRVILASTITSAYLTAS